jgi:C4-dicarboxylate-specific signal transduction histidine kinase
MQMQFDFDKKQAADRLKFIQEKEMGEMKLQKQKAYTYSGLLGIAVTLILLFFVNHNYKRQRIANEKLKEAQAQLIKSEKLAAYGVMASRMAHEIQNPLNFVNNFSELSEELIEEIISSDNREERKEVAQPLLGNIRMISHHGKRAENIVRELQEHTRAGTAHEYFDSGKI